MREMISLVFAEDTFEQAVIELFEGMGYTHISIVTEICLVAGFSLCPCKFRVFVVN